MKLFLRLSSLAVILVCTTIAHGDARLPPPNAEKYMPKPEVKPAPGPSLTLPVDISYVDDKNNGANGANGNIAGKITIPVSMLKALAEKSLIKNSGTLPLTTPAPSEPTSGYPHGGTIIAGLALALAMVSLVYFSRKPAKKWALTGTVAVLLGFGVTSYLLADISFPGRVKREPDQREIVQPRPAGKMVMVEIVDQADRITITVPPKAAD